MDGPIHACGCYLCQYTSQRGGRCGSVCFVSARQQHIAGYLLQCPPGGRADPASLHTCQTLLAALCSQSAPHCPTCCTKQITGYAGRLPCFATALPRTVDMNQRSYVTCTGRQKRAKCGSPRSRLPGSRLHVCRPNGRWHNITSRWLFIAAAKVSTSTSCQSCCLVQFVFSATGLSPLLHTGCEKTA